jgi:undecaprenyl-diphosphatase
MMPKMILVIKADKPNRKNYSDINANNSVIFVGIGALIIFLILLFGTLKGGFFLPVDGWAYSYITSVPKPVIPLVMMIITSIMDLQIAVILGAVVLAVLLVKKRYKHASFFIISLAAGTALWSVIKILVQRPRPEIGVISSSGFSFPSGHSASAALFFGLMIYLFKDDFKSKIGKNIFVAACVAVALLVCFSRFYLEVHWLSDVIAGIALSLFVLFSGIMIFNNS